MKRYSDYLAGIFPGVKVQKISVNAEMGCPNRDGTIGTGGCIYCNNSSFTPGYCMQTGGVTAQLEAGKAFFRRKYPDMRYLAYFQSFTNTYEPDLCRLKALYEEAAATPDVVGIVIGTRPDTLPEPVVEMLGRLNRRLPVMLEIGAETACDETLRLINRGHTWADVESAVRRADAAGLRCGLHLIAGLPGEDDKAVISNVVAACALPVESLKFHQLQIIKGTPLHKLWSEGRIAVHTYTLEEYLELCVRILSVVPQHIVVERFLSQAPPDMVVAPRWGVKNYQFMDRLSRMVQNKTKERGVK